MRRKMKKLVCAILCTCLLIFNTPGSLSYAENTEQYATNTDAAYADVTEVEGTIQAATGTDAEGSDTSSATAVGDAVDSDASSATTEDVLLYATAMVGNVLLYAASEDESGAYKIEINSQADWDNLLAGNNSGWTSSYGAAAYTGDKNLVEIILNTDITLSKTDVLVVNQTTTDPKKLRISGNEHSININTYYFTVISDTVAIENTHFKNGKVQVSNANVGFSCTDSTFSSASIELQSSNPAERVYITGCEFSECPEPCVDSKGAPCPVSFSDCRMDNCGLLFSVANSSEATPCKVSFSGIIATNCTGPVIRKTTTSKDYIIESISGCQLSTSISGLTAIEHEKGAVREITGCTITGFDTGIKLDNCDAGFGTGSDIDTLTISDTTIKDCITGVDIDSLSKYEHAMISGLIMEAREGASGTVGYKGRHGLSTTSFDYDFEQMPQIKGCTITGFDTGINLDTCPIVISGCEITDCNFGVDLSSSKAAIVDTTLMARSSSNGYYKKGVTSNATCFLIDCDINDFDIGSDMTSSGNTAIIGCIYQNKLTNLNAYATSVYDTRFIGGETAVTIHNGSSYFYDCVIEGDAATQSGFTYAEGISANLYIHNLARPYNNPPFGYYDDLYQYSDRTVNNGKSEISNCTTGINAKGSLYIADTHIHDCETGIQSLTTSFYGNNLIEKCTDGVKTDSLSRYESNNGITITDTHVDTIRNCSNNGLSSTTTMASTMAAEWNNRLEIYECGNYGIEVKNTIQDIVVDVHDCKTGIYITADATGTTQFKGTSKIYDNQEWNIYDSSTGTYSQFIILGSEGTLTGGGIGNVYMKHNMGMAIIYPQDLYSDDSVYYLGTDTSMYILSVGNLYGTVVFDTIDSGYTLGRRVALLSNPNHTSQMFAKKEGFIIATEMNGNTPYAVFAAGCDVTYDVTTNGGDTFDGEKLSDEEIKDGKLPQISYLVGENIDLTYTASKTGYEFVGWNTDQNATEGLVPDTLMAEQKDITLYAIYKKTVDINYHTYDAALDYEDVVAFYNNEEEIECELATYNAGGDNTFAGYVLGEDADVSSADDLLNAGDNVTVSPDGLDVYCVYSKQGQLKYLKKDGTTLSTENKTVYQICADNKEFVYTVRAGEPVTGFTFTGWKDEADNSFVAGDTISTMESSIVLTPVYVESTTEDCTVTYDVTTNGGSSFSGGSLTQISYLNGAPIDLTYTASKMGYEFVGWNTNQNAKEGLDALTAGTEDITLYAIYKKTAYISYHTYNAASDYRTAVTFYNNEDEIERGLATYNAGGDNTFVGYCLNENAAVSSADALKKAGDNVTVSPSGLNVYCVYSKQGQIKYLKKDGTTLSTERKTVYQVSTHNKKFVYTVRAGQPVEGFTFTGWKDTTGTSYAAGATISTLESSIVLTPVYVVKEKPTTEATTTEESTTEGPTTETSTTEDSTTETPTTEGSTTEPPSAGPVTGDSTNPIGVIGLGILSLLGILGLTMKNKRKN